MVIFSSCSAAAPVVLLLSGISSDAFNPTGPRGGLLCSTPRLAQSDMGMAQQSLDDINQRCADQFGGAVECVVAPGKGRILKATRSFQPGEVIFKEEASHVVALDEENRAFQVVKHICNTYIVNKSDKGYEDSLLYWAALSSLTNSTLKNQPSVGSLQLISEDQQTRLLSMFHEPVTEASREVATIVSQLQLDVDARLVEELLSVWSLNCHAGACEGVAEIYPLTSLCSHSCWPNADFVEGSNNSLLLEATRAIKSGDEVCSNYLAEDELLASAQARQTMLQESKLFQCTCERCSPSFLVGNEDHCRGFRCEQCGECAVFYRLQEVDGKMLEGVMCKSCGSAVSAKRAAEIKELESILFTNLTRLDRDVKECGHDILDVLQPADVKTWLSFVGNKEFAIGPQHWLYYKLCCYLRDWHSDHPEPPSFFCQDDVDMVRKSSEEYEGDFLAMLFLGAYES